MGLTAADLDLRKRCLELDAGDEQRLRELHEVAGQHLEQVVDALHRRLPSIEETVGPGPEEVERVRHAHLRSLARLTEGSYDQAFAEERLAIGAAHDRIGLEVEHYLASYCLYLREVAGRLTVAFPDPHDAMQAFISLVKLVFLDIGLALDAYIGRREQDVEAAGRDLATFNYAVAHDLRAPLRAFIGFSEALMGDAQDRLDERSRSHLRFIVQSGRLMARLIEELVALAGLSQVEMHVQPVCLSQVAAEVAEPLRLAAEHPVDLRIEQGIWAMGDAGLLSVLLQNLLGNAFKFTSRRPAALIEMGAVAEDRELVVSVRDDGAGFDMERADRLFGPFQRLHSDTEFEGAGMGLAAAQRIVRRHGGRIWAAAGKRGCGATFSFTIPRMWRAEGAGPSGAAPSPAEAIEPG